MKRLLTVAVVASTSAALLTLASATANATQPKFVHVSTPTVATAYNNGVVRIVPRAIATGYHVITSRKLTVYNHGRKVATDSSVRLLAGTYTEVTSGIYKSYRNYRQQRVRVERHEGDFTNGTCKVYKATDLGLGTGITDSYAHCSNPYYPGQRPNDEEFLRYKVGDTYTAKVTFRSEDVNKAYYATVRKYGVAHRFSSRPRTLIVHNGGYRHVFTGSGQGETNNFRPPSGKWRLVYSWNCSNFGQSGNFAIEVYHSNGEYEALAVNDIDYSGAGTSYVHSSGTFYLDITSECNWTVTVRA